MLKKLIILFGIFVIENSINCAEAQNVIGIKYITEITPADLTQIQSGDTCAICLQELLLDTSNLYKSNCPQMFKHSHIFHKNCILGCITSMGPLVTSCPMCRGQMVNLNLIEASLKRNLEIVKLLLDRGADINERANNGDTALICAAVSGHLEIVRLLLDKGADVNARSHFRNTALMPASFNGYLEIVKLLLDRGADVNAKAKNGDTALRFARMNGHQKIADLLIANGAIE